MFTVLSVFMNKKSTSYLMGGEQLTNNAIEYKPAKVNLGAGGNTYL